MRYEVGDEVRIIPDEYREDLRRALLSLDWIVTIKEVVEDGDIYPERYYRIKELPCKWLPCDISDFADPIENRYEILDLRK